MGGFSDVGKKLGLGEDVQKALSTVEDAISLVGSVSSLVGIPGKIIDILTQLGVFSKHDPVREALDRIEGKINELIQQLHDSEKIATLQNIAIFKGKLDSAYFFLKQDAASDTSNKWRDYLQQNVRDSIHALKQHAFYERPYFPEEYYNHFWTGAVTPPVLDGESFEYRLALPTFIYGVLLYVEYIKVFIPNYATQEADEIGDLADHIKFYHDEMLGGFLELREPAPFEVWPRSDYNAVMNYWWRPSFWDWEGERLFGVIDRVSSLPQFVSTYPSEDFPNLPVPPQGFPTALWAPPPGFDDDFAWFRVKHALRTLKGRKELYSAIGLPSMASIYKQLIEMIGRPIDNATGAEESWSIRQVRAVVAQAFPHQWGVSDTAPVSLSQLFSFLGQNRPAPVSFSVGIERIMGSTLWGN